MSTAEIDAAEMLFNPNAALLLQGILALVTFGVALELKVSDFTAIARAPKPVLLGLFAQFALLPAVTYLLTLMLDIPASMKLGMILVAACPGGNISNFIVYLAKGNAALSISITAIATLGAIVMTPININFWGGMADDTAALLTKFNIDPVGMLIMVFVIMGLPLVLGMTCGAKLPNATKRMLPFFKYGSVLALIGFIAVTFTANWTLFVQFGVVITITVVLHNAVAFAIGYTTSRIGGISKPDVRAVTVEVGIQNSGLGLTLIFTFFGGLGGMALVAGSWGSWHIVAGLTLAAIWSRVPTTMPETAEEAA